ncbi:MAG: Flp pilus assembly complex ATPase component [Thermodesulfobacteria bacterium]|nr:Flp pilus assembly complex ATPase component [Thermodesulfobacteriota bacterium]
MANQRKPIGQLLKEKGYITEEYIDFAVREQKATGEKLGEVLVRWGIVTDAEIAYCISEQSGIPFVDLETIFPDPDAFKKVPSRIIQTHHILPFALKDGEIYVAISDPFNNQLISLIERTIPGKVKFFVAAPTVINKFIERYLYFVENPIDKQVEELVERLRLNPNLDFDVEEVLFNLLSLGIYKRATDIHFTPTEKSLQVFLRIDGLLEPLVIFPQSIYRKLINIIKIKSNLDISETRLPQDGRFSFEFLEEKYDLRVSTVRAAFGENVVIRFLPTGAHVQNLAYLGFSEEQASLLREISLKPYGMFLITGPTGSGKTTTLFSCLRLLNLLEKNVLTVEDPIEYKIALIRQTQLNEEIGYTFARAIRTFLRQDPDVILVGEVRDEETASMAVRAALTGHLFLSTLHTNDAVSTIFRLKEMGVSVDLLASTLKGVVAQRLVRKICPNCKERYDPPKELLNYYDLPEDAEYYRGKGCPQCRGKGYVGRTVVAEILYVDEELTKFLAEEHTFREILDTVKSRGFKPLIEDAKRKVLEGITTVEEIRRVVG